MRERCQVVAGEGRMRPAGVAGLGGEIAAKKVLRAPCSVLSVHLCGYPNSAVFQSLAVFQTLAVFIKKAAHRCAAWVEFLAHCAGTT